MIYYETGIEECDSSYHNIFKTQNEEEAIEFWSIKTRSWTKL